MLSNMLITPFILDCPSNEMQPHTMLNPTMEHCHTSVFIALLFSGIMKKWDHRVELETSFTITVAKVAKLNFLLTTPSLNRYYP